MKRRNPGAAALISESASAFIRNLALRKKMPDKAQAPFRHDNFAWIAAVPLSPRDDEANGPADTKSLRIILRRHPVRAAV
jgi:hypothetical protein